MPDERLVETISDTEAIVEGLGPTANYFAHVYRAVNRTEDSWKHHCEGTSVAEIRACPDLRKGGEVLARRSPS